jgi:2',3'-cyclic-nucleotide 3'-phosphodiesterase
MPGSSLWLLPPADHPLTQVLSALIAKTSSKFNSGIRFIPHVTLTSEISPSTYGSDPQAWLDSLHLLSGNDVQVEFQGLGSEDVLVRKLYIKCGKTEGLKQLARLSRQQVDGFEEEGKANDWMEERYMPHLSLMYHDCAPVDVQGLASLDILSVNLEGDGQLGGWVGGRVVLVPTDGPIDQWAPIAKRRL